jgi:SAM-dependent methyltransferase
MSVFGNYARYYNLLYRDKDYAREAQFVHHLIQKYASNSQSILELGCGTGNHAFLLAEMGYQIHGVDLSTDMLQQARDRISSLPKDRSLQLEFSQADMRNFQLNQKFDAAIALFHVMSYQTTNQDLQATLSTVKQHLKPGGIFIFDFWYGPAVLCDRPTARIKRLEDDHIKVVRIAEPIMHPNHNVVDVNYQILIQDRRKGDVEELRETHSMRYLFKPELGLLLERNQLEMLEFSEWITGEETSDRTWNVYCVCRLG